jgi:hypothetical protein
MSVDKIELQRLWLQEHGKALEEKETSANTEIYRLQGAVGCMRGNVLPGIDSVVSVWKKRAVDEEVSKEIFDTAARACEQCGGAVRNLLQAAEEQLLIKKGEALAYRSQLDLVEKQFNALGDHAKALLASVENKIPEGKGPEKDPTRVLRIVGQHPGVGLAEQRKAEEAKSPLPPKPEPPRNRAVQEGSQEGIRPVVAKSIKAKQKGNGAIAAPKVVIPVLKS